MAFTLESKPDFDVHEKAEALEQRSLEEVLAWGWETFGERAALGTSFQGSGLVIMHHLFKKLQIPMPTFTIDTGLLFPETIELKKQLEDFFEIEIESVEPEQTVDEQAASIGPELWKDKPDTCCTMRKVLPLQRKLAELDLWMTGVRRVQSDSRRSTQILEMYRFDELRGLYILKMNPMAAWSKEAVWEYLKEHQIPYNPLHNRGFNSIGCWPCTRAADGSADERAGRWEGFEKTECGIHTFLGDNI